MLQVVCYCLQEAAYRRQESVQSESDIKLHAQLQHAQGQVAKFEAQQAAASEAASQTQAVHSAQLKRLSEQHSGMLSQLRQDHDVQLEAASQHHKASIPSFLIQPSTFLRSSMQCCHELLSHVLLRCFYYDSFAARRFCPMHTTKGRHSKPCRSHWQPPLSCSQNVQLASKAGTKAPPIAR